ncbi:MAG: hypothetical protein ACJAZ6_002346, partial [Oleispira sp.]
MSKDTEERPADDSSVKDEKPADDSSVKDEKPADESLMQGLKNKAFT